MHLWIQPAWSDWSVGKTPARAPVPTDPNRKTSSSLAQNAAAVVPEKNTGQADLTALAQMESQTIGASPWPDQKTLVATGHQAWLWHPGILVKDLAMATAARRFSASMVHLLVDHDVHDALTLEVPLIHQQQLSILKLWLGNQNRLVPTGAQPPVPGEKVLEKLQSLRQEHALRLACSLDRLEEAWHRLPPVRTLAEQIMAVLLRLMQRWIQPPPAVIPSTGLMQTPPGRLILEKMLVDPWHCARTYNQALAEAAEELREVRPLVIENHRVELPLWWIAWLKPRQRVFARRRGETIILENETHQEIDIEQLAPAARELADSQQAVLAPRALLLTALMRAYICDLFIHGRGGTQYDRVAERWWQRWADQPLAASVAVSADLYLRWNVPIAQPADLARALWYRHHAPHNIDRILKLNGPLVQAKRRALEILMNRRTDRRQRAEAFAELHRINAQLAAEHPDVIASAHHQVEQIRLGLANAQVARKRDWCFALYPPHDIDGLVRLLDQASTQQTVPPPGDATPSGGLG